MTVYTMCYTNVFQVSAEGDMRKIHLSAEWDKENDPTKAIVVDGRISPVEVVAGVK